MSWPDPGRHVHEVPSGHQGSAPEEQPHTVLQGRVEHPLDPGSQHLGIDLHAASSTRRNGSLVNPQILPHSWRSYTAGSTSSADRYPMAARRLIATTSVPRSRALRAAMRVQYMARSGKNDESTTSFATFRRASSSRIASTLSAWS